MKKKDAIVIVGAGHSGARAAHALRNEGWDGRITLLGDEGELPYDRPPLSKNVLLRRNLPSDCRLFDELFYRENDIDIRVDARVDLIDRGMRQVHLAKGPSIEYQKLLIATGAEPRTLAVPGCDLLGVHVLRSATDALSVANVLVAGAQIVIVGAGFIGLEIAACAVQRGCKVVIVETAARALMRAVPENVAHTLVARHLAEGVDIRFATQVDKIVGDSKATSVKLSDGSVIECDAVIIGIGVTPRTSLAEAAGIDVADGVAVDDTLRTNDPDVYACGDVCSFPSRLFRRRIRLECWKNAEDQARIVARNLMGRGETYSEVPWFWSDQYDMTIQVSGVPAFGVTTCTRELEAGSKLFFALDRDGFLVGASGVGSLDNIARDMKISQMLIARRLQLDVRLLTDPQVKLKTLLSSVRT